MNGWIAVLAGTPVDTQMGVEYLRTHGLAALACPVAADPVAQTAFQLSPGEEKIRAVGALLDGAMDRGCRAGFVYCNSLAGAVDFGPLARERGLRIVTPLDVYQETARLYSALGVISANAQGLSGIERALLRAKPELRIFGACCLDAVVAVEAGEDPSRLVERLRLSLLADWAQSCGAEALVLGCTHFPWFKDALAERTSLPLIDPADRMLSLLRGE